MRTLQHSLVAAALSLAGAAVSAQATDFSPLMEVARSTWPGQGHIAVVANYKASQSEIEALAMAAGAGMRITVVDTITELGILPAVQQLRSHVKPAYLVLLPNDPLVRDGSFQASRVIGMLAEKGCPTIATTTKSLAQGAVFALGPGTGMELQVSPHPVGTVHVVLPGRAANRGWFEPAQVTVIASR